MASNKLKINLFGEVWKLKQLMLHVDLLIKYEETAKRIKQPLVDVIIDPFFYHYLKSKTIQSVEDLQGKSTERLINSTKNQIEIWYKNKKVQKLKINDLNQDLLLFPLYNTTVDNDNASLENGIYIEQREIGLMGSFEINTDDFNIDNLEFQLVKTNENMFLANMLYKNQGLICKKKDTLITFQNCFEINNAHQTQI